MRVSCAGYPLSSAYNQIKWKGVHPTSQCLYIPCTVVIQRGWNTHWSPVHWMFTLVPEKSVQYVAQFLASADLNCACARFCYSVSPWVTFQKFWNIKWIKICVYCYFNIFMLRRRILQRKRKFRRPLSSMCLIINTPVTKREDAHPNFSNVVFLTPCSTRK